MNERYRHKARGTTHEVIDDYAILQQNGTLRDLDRMVVYRSCEGLGQTWVRSHHEFHDGRFEKIEFAPRPETVEAPVGWDLISRKAVVALCDERASAHADKALTGEPDNARSRESMEAAFRSVQYAVAFMPSAAGATVEAFSARPTTAETEVDAGLAALIREYEHDAEHGYAYDTRMPDSSHSNANAERSRKTAVVLGKVATERATLRAQLAEAEAENKRLVANAQEQAGLMLGYHRLLDRHGVAPSSSVLIYEREQAKAAIAEKEKRIGEQREAIIERSDLIDELLDLPEKAAEEAQEAGRDWEAAALAHLAAEMHSRADRLLSAAEKGSG